MPAPAQNVAFIAPDSKKCAFPSAVFANEFASIGAVEQQEEGSRFCCLAGCNLFGLMFFVLAVFCAVKHEWAGFGVLLGIHLV